MFEYPWNNFLHSSVEQAIYTLLSPESSIFSTQNVNRTANLASSRKQLITDLEAESDAEFDFDVRSGARGAGLSTSRESGSGRGSGFGRDELEQFLGDSPTAAVSAGESAAQADASQASSESSTAAPANDLAHSNSDAPAVQPAEAHSRIVTHVRLLRPCVTRFRTYYCTVQCVHYIMHVWFRQI